MSEPERNLGTLLTSSLAIACCAGLPLLVTALASAAAYAVAGVVVAAVVGALLALAQLRRRAVAARMPDVASGRREFEGRRGGHALPSFVRTGKVSSTGRSPGATSEDSG